MEVIEDYTSGVWIVAAWMTIGNAVADCVDDGTVSGWRMLGMMLEFLLSNLICMQ